MGFKAWAADTADRALSTLVQSAILFVTMAMKEGTPGIEAVLAAFIPPVFTVILSAIPKLTPTLTNRWLDILFRIARTFLVTSIGVVVADGFDLLQASSWTAALLLGGSAVLVLVKAELAKWVAERRHESPEPVESISTTSFAWKTTA